MRIPCISLASSLLAACLSLMPLCAFSQDGNGAKKGSAKKGEEYKKSVVVKSYRASVKSKDYGKAKQEIDKAMSAHAEAATDTKLYTYKIYALNELIKQENRKIYLNQHPDTVAYFRYVYELYDTGLRCDSIEQAELAEKRNEGKKAKAKLRASVGNALLAYRTNLLNAGKFYYKKKDYANAFKYIDMYLQTKNRWVFDTEDGGVATHDPDDRTSMSTLAVLSAYASSNYSGVMTYIDESVKDTGVKSQMLEIGYKTAMAMQDSVAMLSFLKQGFESYPDVEYFFMSLVRFYDSCNDYQHALDAIDKMLALYPDNRDYNYMRGKHLLLLKRDDDATDSFLKCLELQADDAESHSLLGDIYLKKAQEAYFSFNLSLSDPDYSKRRKEIMEIYAHACEYYENAKKYDENNRQLWLEGLRETYFKLNKGKELRSLEKYK